MADKAWKQEERQAAALIGGTRYPANQGGKADVEGPQFVGQVKLVKRRAGQGIPTPRLVAMTQAVFETLTRELTGKADNGHEAA